MIDTSASRRAFLKALGLGAASLAACERIPVRHALPYLIPPEEVTLGVPAFYASTCTACPAGCGLLGKVLSGRPVKLEGNRAHPLSRGGLCASGQAWLRSLYDPRRLATPTIAGRPVGFPELDAFVREGLERVEAEGLALRVITRTVASPLARETLAAFAERHRGSVVVHDLDPRTPSALLEAAELVYGSPFVPAIRPDRADVLVSFASDLFGAGAEPVAHTSGWAERRRRAKENGAPRHVQIEAGLTLTGAAADERWLASSAERRAIAAGLLRMVAEATGNAPVADALRRLPEPRESERTRKLGSELLASRGRSLVVSGDNDLVEQLAALLLNRLLGNEGTTVDVDSPALVGGGLDRDLEALQRELLDGRVGALFVVGVDLVGLSPEGDAVADAIRRLPLSVAVNDRPSATTAAAQAVAAAHHGLECWTEAEPRPGLRTLAQPLVRPLFATRHPFENFLIWGNASETDWRRQLENAWRARGEWTENVRSGGLSSAAVEPRPEGPAASIERTLSALSVEAPPELALEVELTNEVFFRNEADADNPWLRELPDPLTRVSWVPTVRLSPSLAQKQQIVDGDLLKVSTDKGAIVLPARIVAGQHPRVVSVPLGYDASASENAARLTRIEGGRLRYAGIAASIERTGARRDLPLVQVDARTEDRPVVFQVGGPNESVHAPHHPEETLWSERPAPEPGTPHWEMVIDLDACTGCSACVIACQAENNIPVVGEDEVRRQREMHWLRLDRYFVGEETTPDVLFEPMLCAQCDNAPCETVCPVAATVHSQDGLNQQVYNRCVGTRYCANNCPYKVRRFNWFDNQPADPLERLVLNPDVVVRSRGVMEKCTFCVQRIQAERISARREGRERRLPETACQKSCPAQAIRFGDGDDSGGEVARLREEPRAFQVLAELGVRPSITYLARIRNRKSEEGGDAHGRS